MVRGGRGRGSRRGVQEGGRGGEGVVVEWKVVKVRLRC